MTDEVAGVVAALTRGEVAAGARAIRWLDDRDPRGFRLLREIFPLVGRAHVVGVTGPPGAGKSTLIDMLVGEWRVRGQRVAVLAVDPSSPWSGGAILGDRVRMQRHSSDPGVFLRSMGSRGGRGGLSRATHDAAFVLDAMGYDIILVETVGVGQEEMEIVALAHTTLIVAVPGLGDEIQALKAGLFEAGDIFLINKADREGAGALRRELEMMLELRRRHGLRDGGREVPLLEAVARDGKGGEAIVDAVARHGEWLRTHGGFAEATGRRCRHLFRLALEERIADHAARLAEGLADDVGAGRIDPYEAAGIVAGRAGF